MLSTEEEQAFIENNQDIARILDGVAAVAVPDYAVMDVTSA